MKRCCEGCHQELPATTKGRACSFYCAGLVLSREGVLGPTATIRLENAKAGKGQR
jgi:hypothetical protein